MNESDKHIVAYTDGSAIPNPGISGYGSHMYIYGSVDKKNKIKTVLGKHSATNNGYISKSLFKTNNDDTVVEVPIMKVIDLYGYENDCNTNNTAELYAVCNTLRLLSNPIYENIFEDVKSITFNIDSNYVINMFTKLIDGVDIDKHINANRHIAYKINDAITLVKNKDISIKILKVKGHSGDLGNDRADMLADMGRLLRSNTDNVNIKVVLEDRDNYYGHRVERDPMLNAPLLFNYNINRKDEDDEMFYCMVNYKDEVEIGKPNNAICYNILYKENTDKELIELSKLSDRILDNVNTPNILLLNNYYNKEVYNNIRMYGSDYTTLENRVIKRIHTIDGIELVKEVYPPGLSYKAFDINEELISYLNSYILKESPSNHIILDITDKYFMKNDKDKTIMIPEIVNDKFKLKVDVKPYTGYGKKLKIVFGLDILKRNNLKRLEKDNVKVDLVLIKYKKYFKYFTIVSTVDKDGKKKYLLSSNYYTNTVYI
jgi:ribonuclease HI